MRMGIGSSWNGRNELKIYPKPGRNEVLLASLYFLLLSVIIPHSLGADTIAGNQSLTGDQTIVSSGGNFELGFFRPGKSSNYYIGIWYSYSRVSLETVVWVANRNTPVSDKFSAELKIVDGNLVLLSQFKTLIWSTGLNSTNRSLVLAVLLDDGNLVLREGSRTTSSFLPIWQSFDHPTHTFLPGNKLGYNKRTNTSQLLISWRSSEDPATGLYSLELDPIEAQYIIKWNGSEKYWTSGPWNGRIFSLVPEMRLNYIYNFSFVANEHESYFTYSLYNHSIISRFIMDVSGQVKQLSWLENTQEWNLFWSQPRQQCEVYAFCGSFGICSQRSLPFCSCLTGFKPRSERDWNLNDYSGGCVRKTDLNCGSSESTGHEKNVEFLPTFSRDYVAFEKTILLQNMDNMTESECKSLCLYYCACDAYVYINSKCRIWNGGIMDLRLESVSSMMTINIKVFSSDLHPSRTRIENPSRTRIEKLAAGIIAACVGVVLLLLCVVGFIFCGRVRKRESRGQNLGNSEIQFYSNAERVNFLIDPGKLGVDDKKHIDVPFLEFNTILAATNFFSDSNKLGQGGFGPVYKGNLPEGEIAVKRLSSHSGQGLKEFRNEVLLIAKLQHRNLVRLLGYSMHEHEMILVYEFMPNKSLDHFIFDRRLSVLLDWTIRFDIILGIARGLLYLHQDSRLRIIHRDFKTSNILLDEDMNPKVSDFGLAKIVKGRETEASTQRVIGTYGYMSPEYALDGLFSIKSDVFSFGVVVLEIISGKRNTGFYQSQQALSLLGYAWSLWTGGKPLDLLDQSLLESCNSIEVVKCIIVGLLCVQEDPSDRPTMTDVLVMLGTDIASLPNPKKPAFVTRKHLSSSLSSSNKSELQSINMLTITEEEGR